LASPRRPGMMTGTGYPKGNAPAVYPGMTTAEIKAHLEEEKGPLGFLDRLMDNERNTNLYLGDVRFWQHLEHIDRNNLYRITTLEYRTMKMMFFEAFFYALFLLFLTGFICSLRTGDLFEMRRQQLDYWAGCGYMTGIRTCTVDNVKDIPGLFNWLRDDLAPKAFTFQDEYPSVVNSPSIYTLQDNTMHWKPRYIGDTQTSVLLGTIRIRQLRVQYNADCEVLTDLQSVHSDCFPAFSSGVQSKLPWAPAWTPPNLTAYYRWREANETDQTSISGYHGEYPGDGFYFDMPLRLDTAKRLMRELEGWQWLDQRSRALIVELNTFNPNTNIFVHHRMLFEFPAVGGLIMKQEVFAFRAMQLSLPLMATDDGDGTFVYFILTTAMHMLLFVYTCWLVWKNGLRYFSLFWSWIDLLILLLFLVYASYVATGFARAAYEPALQPEVIMDYELFFPIGRLVPVLDAGNSTLAWLGLFGWLKILKYFLLVTPFMPFVRVVEGCIVNLLRFAQLFIIVLMGFALGLYLGYGDETNLFSTLGGSFVAVMVLPAGGVDLSPLIDDDTFLGPALIFLYTIIVFLLLLNTFLAICVETYSVSSFQINECYASKHPGEESPTAVFLWTYWNALKGVKLVGKETVEQMGEPDEQRIRLTSLPEALQVRFLDTKRRMERLLSSATEEIAAKTRAQLQLEGVLSPRETGPSPAGSKTPAILDASNSQGPTGAALAIKDGSQNGQGPRAVALARKDDAVPRPPSQEPVRAPPPPSQEACNLFVHRVQIQRMLDDDPTLRQICDSDRAIDIIRRFRVDNSGIDPYEAVAELQKNVARKLGELESNGFGLSFNEMDTLKQVSTELHNALTEAQKEWRQELVRVMQMTSLLSHALIDLTKRMEAVQINHNNLIMQAGLA